MSPRSTMSFQPKLSRSFVTVPFAAASLPLTKTLCAPSASCMGPTIRYAFMVFSVLTTLVWGKARWICSPSESVLQTVARAAY